MAAWRGGWAATAATTLCMLSTGCAQAQSKVGAWRAAHRPSPLIADERVFSVQWWARADRTFGLPYHPIEPGEPEVSSDGRVFAGTSDGKVRAFDSRGRFLWERNLESPYDTGPTLAGNRLYVATAKGGLFALDASTGEVAWRYAAAEELITKPIVAGGLVIVVSTADTLYAVDEAKGEWRWQYRREVPADFTIRGAGQPAVAEGRVFAGFADGYAVGLDLKDGALIWAKDLGARKTFADVDAGPVVDSAGRVFFASFATGVFGLEAASGRLLWNTPQPGVGALALDDGKRVLYAGGNGFVASYSSDDGTKRWAEPLGRDRFVSGMSVVNGLVLASMGPGPLLFLDGGTGKYRELFNPGRGVWAKANVQGTNAYVLSNRGVLYDLAVEARGTP